MSKAGQRAGLQGGTRSGLVYEVLRLLHELHEVDNLPKVLIMENVVDLIQVNFIDEWNRIALEIEKLGYTNYTFTMNGRNYGIAQNRDRVFMVSILGDYNFVEPKEFELKYKLKDYLEENVDESYYLSDKMFDYLNSDHPKHKRKDKFEKNQKPLDYKGWSNTITTRETNVVDSTFIKVPEATVKEIWKDIPNYEGYYQASNKGNIRSLERFLVDSLGRKQRIPFEILKNSKDSAGYTIFTLRKHNDKKQWKGHRLVAKSFIPNPENKPQVNHINGIKYDNRIENLEWVSAEENMKHAYETGLINDGYHTMVTNLKSGEVKHFHSQKDACSFLDMSKNFISTKISRNKIKEFEHNGFKIEILEGVPIPEATKKGWKEAKEGDGVYLNRAHQKRGVVQKGMIQTLKTSGNDVGVVVNAKRELCNTLVEKGFVEENDMIRHSYTNNRMEDLSRKENENNISATLTTRPDTLGVVVGAIRGRYDESGNIKQRLETNGSESSNTLTTVQKDNVVVEREIKHIGTFDHKSSDNFMKGKSRFSGNLDISDVIITDPRKGVVENNLRIRKLTPKETLRLMGGLDEWFEKQSQVTSNAQMYKQHGNGIIAQVIGLIIGSMYYEDYEVLKETMFKNSFDWIK